ncbi:MAG: transglutaminase family protein [Cyanophyceae cyanobacterium]
MRHHIVHQFTYRYSAPVQLGTHLLRLRPREEGGQRLHHFHVEVTPAPVGRSELVDLHGNGVLQLWFDDRATETLSVRTEATVGTDRPNPFNFLLDPWATRLPIDYPSSQRRALEPYLAGDRPDPIATQLAWELGDRADYQPLAFLGLLNQHIYRHCTYEIRETGDARPAGFTWQQRRGSCRDFAVLFMEVCRAIGLGARFVSGYEAGDPEHPHKYLHAWVEVYLPGGGWRGYDPTQGLAVGDGYIPVAAAPEASQTAPFPGIFQGRNITADLTSSLEITPVPEPLPDGSPDPNP